MTNEELLQQAKDQVAEKHWKFENWDALEKHFRSEGDAVGYLAYFEIAAKLAIQSAREEGEKEGYKEGYRFGWENRGLPSYLHPTLAPDRPITENEREEIRQEWLESGRDSPEAEHLNNG